MLTDRERFLRCCLGQDVDRPPFWLVWGPWGTAWERWKREGMPFDSWGKVRESFGAECPPLSIPVLCGPCPRFEHRIVEETSEWYIWIDTWGIKRRNFRGQESMSEFLEFPVKGRDDWERYKKERLDPHNAGRLAGDWLATCRKWMEWNVPIQLGSYPDVTLFGGIRWLLGDEECLLSFYTQPDLIADIMNHLTDLYLHVFGAVVGQGVRVDSIHMWEDMSGRQGSLISPAHFRQFMTPNYARIKEFAVRHNIPVMSVDTDGNPDNIVSPMMEGGVNYLYPMEVAAGCDVNEFQKRYPTLAFMGNLDKRAVASGPDAIEAEVQRLLPAVRRGRFIPDMDHLIPDDISWENLQHYARALKRLSE